MDHLSIHDFHTPEYSLCFLKIRRQDEVCEERKIHTSRILLSHITPTVSSGHSVVCTDTEDFLEGAIDPSNEHYFLYVVGLFVFGFGGK